VTPSSNLHDYQRRVNALRTGDTSSVPTELIRQYDPGDRGLKNANTESNLLAAHGYRIAAQTDTDGHVNLGRLALTGGLGLLFGGTRSKGRVTITFEKSSAR
jgi:hypothetical protein